ncbi:MAG: SDR family NAD(P)-dependent oxidoreductase, partial [Candidatus Brocadiae bacterium]|nr:SDR family NAD(P)-dependent oxidoreductase [Candidatus Brocadiia bacterium]
PQNSKAISAEIALKRYTNKAIESKPARVAMEGIIHAKPLYIVKDNREIYQSLEKYFYDAGINTSVVDNVPEDACCVLYLRGLDALSQDTHESHRKVCEAAFVAAKICANNLFQNQEKHGFFVTVQDTGGDFGIESNMEKGILCGSALSALVKTAAQEWENASVKAIDIECNGSSKEEIAKKIFDEIIFGGNEIEVGIQKDGKRVIIATELTEEVLANHEMQDGDVILVSGGARGVTSSCLCELSLGKKLKMAILGRTELVDEPVFANSIEGEAALKKIFLEKYTEQGKSITPSQLSQEVNKVLACREIRKTLSQIHENGSKARYFSVDINHFEELQKAVEQIREEWGQIHGIIHAAGVLADKQIRETTIEQFRAVFNTKVLGFYNMLEATSRDNLSHICCFSSVAARYGNKGQAAYSMGNEVLNKVCKKKYFQSKGKCLVKSINWGPWDGGMVTPFLKSHFEANGISLIPAKAGAKRFVEEFSNIDSSVEVLIGSPIALVQNQAENRKWLIRIHKDTHPYMESHKIMGTPVVPATFVNETCLKLAKKAYPLDDFRYIKKFKILKGMKLNDYSGKGDWFYISCNEAKEGNQRKLIFEVTSLQDIKHYCMEIIPNTMPEFNPIAFEEKPQNWNLELSDIYNDKLFHGKDFQGIKKLLWIEGNKCAAILYKKEPLDTKNYDLFGNATIFDAGMQVGLLWGIHNYQYKRLPVGYKELYMLQEVHYDEDILCIVEAIDANETYIKINFAFFTMDGKLLAQFMEGCMFTYNTGGDANV